MSKEVIFLGLGETREECPSDPKCEVWSVNDAYEYVDVEIDKLFIVDRINSIEFKYENLSKQKCIVASVPYPSHPEWNIEVYPIQEVLDRFETRFFSSAICYMMAYALLKGYEKIYFYGIDHLTTSAYIIEKGAVEYWMGLAKGLGVEVIVTDRSCTGKTLDNRMYGYWPHVPEALIEHPEELARVVRELAPTLPGVVDESEEYYESPPGSGNWVRKKQVIRVTQQELLQREMDLRGETVIA